MSRQPNDPLAEPEWNLGSIRLWIAEETPEMPAGTIRRGLIDSGRLGTTVESFLETDLTASFNAPPQVTWQNPFLTPAEKANLDETGLIRVGTTVSEGDVIASVVRAMGTSQGDEVRVGDGSWLVPSAWHQSVVKEIHREVTAGRRRYFPKGVIERITVRLQRQVPFLLSDALKIGDSVVRTTYLRDDSTLPRTPTGEPVDLIVSHWVARTLGLQKEEARQVSVERTDVPAIDVLTARNVGAYSLISATPLGNHGSRRAGVRVRENQIQWLLSRGLYGLVQEFVSLKYNDLENRDSLKQLAATGVSPLLNAAAPESFIEVQEYLWALGLAPEFRSIDHRVELRLRPATNEQILSRSCGAVRKPETINYRTFNPEPGGLFCETIFGQEHSLTRRRRSGHILLSEPIIPIFWRLGSEPLLARRLKLPAKRVESLIAHQIDAYERQGAIEFRPHDVNLDKKLVAEGWSRIGTGARAIQELVRLIPADPTLNWTVSQVTDFSTHVIPVIPPDFRPLVLLDSGNFATSDLNDLYRRIVNRNNRLSKLKELNAPAPILNNETAQLQKAVDALQANEFGSSSHRVMAEAKRPLKSILSILCGRINHIDRRRVDWSGQARAIVNSEVAEGTIGLPAEIYDALYIPANQRSIPAKQQEGNKHESASIHAETDQGPQEADKEFPMPSPIGTSTGQRELDRGSVSPDSRNRGHERFILVTSRLGSFLARAPYRIEGNLIHVSPDDAQILFDDESTVEVHRPLTELGRQETAQIFTADFEFEETSSRDDVSDSYDWFEPDDDSGVIENLIRAAGSGRSVALKSLKAISTLGLVPKTSNVIDVAAPPPYPYHTAAPWHTELKPIPELQAIHAVIHDHQRRSCLLHVTEAAESLAPELGRYGGRPWLPSDQSWPLASNGVPMTFVCQIPLEAIRLTKILPFEIAPNSLLTLFWAKDLEEFVASDECLILIHSVFDLVEVSPPSVSDAPLAIQGFQSEMCDLSPDLLTATEIVAWELDCSKDFVHEILSQDYSVHFYNPLDVNRIGGHPIGNPPRNEQEFIAQIHFGSLPHINDEEPGTIFIYGKSPNQLQGFMQSK